MFRGNLTEGVAHCNHCNAKSVRSFEEKTYEPKVYVMPKWENITELPDNVVKWFEGRGIYQKTLKENKISFGCEYMPSKQREVQTIQFPYIVGDNVLNVNIVRLTSILKCIRTQKRFCTV